MDQTAELPQARPVEENLETEKEARAKIRDFVHDPRLKFHFSHPRRLRSILRIGAASMEFGSRVGERVEAELGTRDPRAVSIVDREKNLSGVNGEWDSGGEELEDWWVRKFTTWKDYVGYLLPSDLPTRELSPHTNESLVPVRISPKRIEGLILVDTESLHEPLRVELLPAILSDFYGIDVISMADKYPEIGRVERRLEKFYRENPDDSAEWTQPVKAKLQELLEQRHIACGNAAATELDKILGTSPTSINKLEIFKKFAKEARIPLYLVGDQFKSQRVVWPPPENHG